MPKTITDFSNVDVVHPSLLAQQDIYDLVDDCIAGQDKIKHETTKYLPKPNAEENSKLNDQRYKSYIERAVFYNVVERTLEGLNGQAFVRDPEIKLTTRVGRMQEDIGGNISLMQMVKDLNSQVLSLGRGGLFTDFPNTQNRITKKQLETGLVRPTIHAYHPNAITNWGEEMVGADMLLTFVVLKEHYLTDPDPFKHDTDVQYRVLSLDSKLRYKVDLVRNTDGTWRSINTVYPKKFNGEVFNRLPFHFVGSKNNDATVDRAPMKDISYVNIAHYRNSADYEDSCYMVGQPTLVVKGVTEDWHKKVMKKRIHLGSRGGFSVGKDGDAYLLQANPNTMPHEAMKQKEDQMVALGAKLIIPNNTEKTATEANIEKSAENTILSTVTQNTSEATEDALKDAAEYLGENPDSISFSMNTEFDLMMMSAEERRELVASWQAGALTFTEMRSGMRKAGLATEDDEVAEAEMIAEQERKQALMNPPEESEDDGSDDEDSDNDS